MLVGYPCHLLYGTLKLIQENGTVVVDLPAHTSHVLLTLNVGVFCPMEKHFRRYLSARYVSSKASSMRNNMFTICELPSRDYNTSVTPENIIGGFRRTGLWSNIAPRTDPKSIRPTDLMSALVSSCELEKLPSTRPYSIIADALSDLSSRITTIQTS